MGTVVGMVGILVTIAAVAWILVARTPDHDEAVHHRPGEPDGRDASQSVAGPAGPGAEDQVPPRPLDPGRRGDPGERST
jgi:hypothetical protein